jgi:N-acetyltransferase
LDAAQDCDWTWMFMDLRTRDRMDEWIQLALSAQQKGTDYPFTVFSRHDDKILGSTRYLDVRTPHRGVEIGWTWYTSKVWGTVVNPECKFLLLRHAFEDWRAVRVQLKTDGDNVHSQKAILKLGASFEGRLRNHRVRRDGSPADSMMYSITEEEWRTSVRSSLSSRVALLGQPTGIQGDSAAAALRQSADFTSTS